MRHLRRLGDESGIALIMALGIMVILGITLITVVDYSTSNTRTSSFSKANQVAFAGAEAGINNSLAVLNLSTNNALKQSTLPACTGAQSGWNHNNYDGGGTVDWCGDLDQTTAVWSIKAIGSARNPNGAPTTRTLTAKVPVTPIVSEANNNPTWNYMFATVTGGACDETLNNNVAGGSRMYVMGNLCLGNNVALSPSALVVKGNVVLNNNASVGASTSMATRVEAYIGGSCEYAGGTVHTPCAGDTDHVYSKKNPPTYVTGVNTSPILLSAPTPSWDSWYTNSMPGPSQACTTISPGPGSPLTFDGNYPTRDNSVLAVQDLTPSTSYTCRVGPAAVLRTTTLSSAMTAADTTLQVASASGFPVFGTFRITVGSENMMVTAGAGSGTWTVTRGIDGTTAAAHSSGATVSHTDPSTGELSWNAGTKTLTISGTIFIDGSAKVANGALNQYNGQGTLYLSGTFYLDGQLCGGVSGSNCDFASWNPNTEMLTIVAGGNGGQVAPGDSIQLANNSSFQGALYGTNAVQYGNNSYSDGPVVGSTLILSNNVNTNSFSNIVTVPTGMPGNPDVYAQPNPAQLFSG